jgi:hypothetical protein
MLPRIFLRKEFLKEKKEKKELFFVGKTGNLV